MSDEPRDDASTQRPDDAETRVVPAVGEDQVETRVRPAVTDETRVIPAAAEEPETRVLPAVDEPVAVASEPVEEPAQRRRPLWPYALGLLVLVLGGVYVAGYLMAGDTVPKSTTVEGVALGGMTRDQAVAELEKQLAPRATAPMTVTVEGRSGTLQPAAAGLGVDYGATVASSGVGRSWSPAHIVRVLTGGGSVDLVRVTDDAKLSAAVAGLAGTFDSKPKDAALAYEGVTPKVTPGVTGVTTDQPATAQAVKKAYLASTSVAGVASKVDPPVTTAKAEELAKGWATNAVSGPITLDTGQGTFTVAPAAIAASVTFPVKDGTISPLVDYNKLFAASTESMKGLQLGAPVDAKIGFGADGKPSITPSKDGLTITPAKFAEGVDPLLGRPADQKTGKVEATAQKAAFTTEAAQALGVKEIIGEFTTNWPHADYRNTNIGKAAAGINGTLLKPGETFSLNKVLGPRTPENGYVDGYVIQGGVLVKETGGGISQSATTTYNAMFFAGLKDVEHHPHMFYIDRYPPGREATVYYGSLDLQFQNDTPYGVLVQAFISPSSSGKQGSVTVRMWSTKVWDEVRSSELVKSNFTSPATRTSTSPTCEPQGATQGFDVNYSRQFVKGGQVAREEKFFWRYAPEDRIVCSKG